MTHTRITAVWTGTAGLPGYSRFNFDGTLDGTQAAAAAARVKTFFQTFATLIPSAVSINCTPLAQVLDIDGVLLSEVAFSPPSALVGSASGTFAAPAGACVNWSTGAVVGGKKVRGRTFVVPLGSVAYESDGTLLGTARTNINDAATSLRGGTPALMICGVRVGGASFEATVTSAGVSDRVSILRSRRG